MRLDEIGALVRGGDLRAALERRRAELERERRLVEERLAALDITVAGEARPMSWSARWPSSRSRVMASGAVPDAFYELESLRPRRAAAGRIGRRARSRR